MNPMDKLTSAQHQAVVRVTRQFPVKLGELAKELGVKVFRATLPAGISGEIRREMDNTYVIRINRHETPERQRFTLAHEIGHFLLHKEAIGDGIADDALYRSRLSNTLEYEANRFAAELLMPRAAIEKLTENTELADDDLVEVVSSKFGVSKQAAQIRLGI